MTQTPAPFIIVAGMGPVGMTAALSLARQGLPVTVLEAGPDLAEESRASTFHPPSLEILRDLGVADELIALGLKAPGFQYRGHDRELIAHLDMSVLAADTDFPYRLQCEQSKLTRIIRARLEQLPNVTLRFSAPVQRVEAGTDTVRVYLEGDGFEPSYTADWLLAADGANSAARRSLGIAFEGMTYPERFLVASTTHDFCQDIPDLALVSYIYDPDDWGVLLRTPAHWRVLFPIPPEITSEQALDPDLIQTRLQGVITLEGGYEVVHSTIYAVHQRVAATFALGRALLLGDAAHINNPLGGMGMNSGLQDAHAAALAIGYAVGGGDPARAAAAYAHVRRDAALLDVQQNTHKNYEEMRQDDERLRRERRAEIISVAADPQRARAYLRVASMLASFQTSARRMRRGLTPIQPALAPSAGARLSDVLRDWGLPGTPVRCLLSATTVPLPDTDACTERLLAAVSGYPAAVVTGVPDGADLAELVARCERAGAAAIELSDPVQVKAAAARRRDLLVIGTVDVSGRAAADAAGDAAALSTCGADVLAVIGTHDPADLDVLHRAAPGVPLAVTAYDGQLDDRITLTLAGVGLVLDRTAAVPAA